MYCNQCGEKVGNKDKFCPNCGRPVVTPSAGSHAQSPQTPRSPYTNQAPNAGQAPYANQAPQTSRPTANTARQNVPSGVPDPSQGAGNVRYVYVDPQTGKIATPPHGKSRSESFMQWMTIAFIAIGLVIVMVAGSMFISGYMVKSVFADNVVSAPMDDFLTSEDEQTVSSQEEDVVSSEDEIEVDSEADVSSELVVSSEPAVPENLRASYIQSHLKGKWTTSIPYKSMSLPATFVFDGKGKCSCEMKALFITKKFDGTYTVKDGGRCAITLNGLEEYVSDGNTMEGKIEIVRDNKINFTVGNVVWELNKA